MVEPTILSPSEIRANADLVARMKKKEPSSTFVSLEIEDGVAQVKEGKNSSSNGVVVQEEARKKKMSSLVRLFLACMISGGIQYGWALQLSLLSPYAQCSIFKSVPFFGPLEGSLDNAAWSESDNLNRPEGSENLSCPQESVQGFASLTSIKIEDCNSLTSISLPVWSSNLPSLEELYIRGCDSLTSIGVCGASSSGSSGSGVKGFSSLAEISILSCRELLSLDEFLTPDYLHVVKAVSVRSCRRLTSLPVDRLEGLQDLKISNCPNLNTQRVMTFPSSLKKLVLYRCVRIESININDSQLRGCSSGLEYLHISGCTGLKSIGGAPAIDRIKNVSISECPELEEIQQPVTRGVITECWY